MVAGGLPAAHAGARAASIDRAAQARDRFGLSRIGLSRIGIALAVALAVLLIGAAGAMASPTVSVYDGSAVTIRPDQPLPAGAQSAATVAAAGNEFADFQIAIQADANGISSLTVKPSASGVLTREGGQETIPIAGSGSDATIYREATYDVRANPGPSDAEGGVGQWPDALIPSVDYLYGETRNAFPYQVAPNGEVTAWVDLFVPSGQTPGTYTGSLDVDNGASTSPTPAPNVPGPGQPHSGATASGWSLSGVGSRHARLSLAVVAGSSPIKSLSVSLPSGLSVNGRSARSLTKGVSLRSAAGKAVRFAIARVRNGLVLKLAAAQAGLHLLVTSADVSVTSSLGKRVSEGKVTALVLPITVLSADGTTTHIALHVKV